MRSPPSPNDLDRAGSGGNADQSGALATLASKTGGAVVLWIAAIGLLGMALWRLAETIVGSHPNEPTDEEDGAKKHLKRVKSLSLAIVNAGLVVIGVGGYHLYKGISKKFRKDLKVSGGQLVTPLGVAGYTAKGLVLGGAGVLVIVATLTSDPAKAAGLDAAVKSLGQAPFGKFLLILAALGIAAYGAYCFVQARFARM